MASLLVVEDELDIQTLLENFLVADGHQVTLASDGVEALALFGKGEFDLVLLDIMIPKIDGYGVCEVIRKTSQIPVIMLTALDSEDHQLRGFDLQVDDYIIKPFSMKVLLRKVEAVLRRSGRQEMDAMAGDKLCHGNICVDLQAHNVAVGGEDVLLTPKEYDLLVKLLTSRGRVWTRELLLESVWGYDFLGDARVVDTHIKNLRRKLGSDPIQTIRGVGYRIDQAD